MRKNTPNQKENTTNVTPNKNTEKEEIKMNKSRNGKTSKKENRLEGLIAAHFGSQDAPLWTERIGTFSTDSEFCVAVMDGREGEDEEMFIAMESYDEALNEVLARKTGRPVSDFENMQTEEWESLFAEWSPKMTKRDRRFIEEHVQKELAVLRRERGWQAPEEESRKGPRKKMVKALGEKKVALDEGDFTWDDLEVFPATNILVEYFDKEGFSYEIQPGFDISYLILDCGGDGWGPLDVRIGSTEGKDLVVLSDPLEVCPPEKQEEMLSLLNRLNSENHPATVFMEEEGEIRVRWNLLCEEENLIPTACEALGRVVNRMNEVMPLVWDLLEN